MQAVLSTNAAVARAASIGSAVVVRAAGANGSARAVRANGSWGSANRGNMIRGERSERTSGKQSLREVKGVSKN